MSRSMTLSVRSLEVTEEGVGEDANSATEALHHAGPEAAGPAPLLGLSDLLSLSPVSSDSTRTAKPRFYHYMCPLWAH